MKGTTSLKLTYWPCIPEMSYRKRELEHHRRISFEFHGICSTEWGHTDITEKMQKCLKYSVLWACCIAEGAQLCFSVMI